VIGTPSQPFPQGGGNSGLQTESAGGKLAAQGLRAAGVETLFTLAGGHIMPLLDCCVSVGLRVIDTRHEGAAALAAEGWALATGDAGCAVVTAGPGFTNALTGLFDAEAQHVPLVMIAGRTGLKNAGRGAVGELQQAAIAAPGVKWGATCLEAGRAFHCISEAFYRARAGRPGAVYLELPQDILLQAASEPEPGAGFPSPIPRPAAPLGDLEQTVAILRQAERPLLIAGGGAFWSGAGEELIAFAERAHVPVITTSAARGLIPDRHPCCLGSLVHGGIALLAADAVLVLGSGFNANLAYGRPPLFAAEQRVIQVDIVAEGIGGNRRPDLALAGDVAQVLRGLVALWPGAEEGTRAARESWLTQARAWSEDSRAGWDSQIEDSPSIGIHTGALARELAAWARDETEGACTLVADGGDALAWGLGYFFAEKPGRMLSTTTALGTLGVGLPFAVSASAARPQEPVLVLAGDGSFGLSALELDTMVRHRLPVVVVVSNNHGWGDIRHEHQELRDYAGPRVAAELASSRYDRLAQALGAHGEHVTQLNQLRPALARALASGLPAVVNVETDPRVQSRLLEVVAKMNLM
jgi:acetolactate synthase I/II/III large subunit